MRHYTEIELWKDVTEEQWNDWHWQVRNRITTVEDLKKVINLTPEEEKGIQEALKKLRMGITPYYALLMDKDDSNCPIRKQAVPTIYETYISDADMEDPLHEDTDSPVPGLTHRYPDRVLLLITDMCSMYCRHCTRRRFAGQKDDEMPLDRIDAAIEYIRNTPQVRDVLLSGGDCLLVSDERLEYIIKKLREIPHVEIVRLGTRTPVVLPQRITPELVNMLKKYHPIWLNTHFNHSKEMTPESRKALALLADAGIPLGNQTVLLRGVNDCVHVMRNLVHDLVKNRVRPYYIYQCDLSVGIEHFRTPVAKGLEIMEALRGHTSGYAVPTFVVDAPGGGGKIPVMPNYVVSQSSRRVVLRNYEGVITTYTEPAPYKDECNCPVCRKEREHKLTGVAGLLQGNQVALEPADLERHKRAQHK
ncbi:L-lysine 2,3-aminomutase [Caminicella sporogenes DSM 14501]|uniref:L-lysine 2,3-aminomutase n=1 Tax=Caminicella sporogenes DSM 14501 TaxID=1121266 RepID=A0A1M6PPZ5_9FIRM|nr:lysine 2,3-aminomutase [Caminicella sporogenes]RKD22025.1 lysine 2,3-aminomutase [Caminicella sporogenes]WIF96014.1 lysine 2,3-aminomutase [Caminicella sporogenes]SHK09938.1 L-lysine 2,3-aminomutase [Caminicella sporogenes DSM 14501]